MEDAVFGLTIGRKLLALVVIALAFTATVGVVGYRAVGEMQDLLGQSFSSARDSNRSVLLDMMHDCLRADVFNAVLHDTEVNELIFHLNPCWQLDSVAQGASSPPADAPARHS